MEQWRPIAGFEGKYEISNRGRVRSLARNHDKIPHICWPESIMKLITHTNGYMVIWLCKNGTKRKFFVHRLVAYAFLEPVDGKDYVNHKDKNRRNNWLENLEFMTHQENMDHRDGKINSDEPF